MVSGQSEVDINMQKELKEVDKMYLQEERQIEQVEGTLFQNSHAKAIKTVNSSVIQTHTDR